MAGAAAPALFFGTLALLLLGCVCTPLADTESLCLDFTVTAQPRPGQVWFQVRGSVSAVPFLQYDNANKAIPLGLLGKEVNTTEAWTDLIQTLQEVGEELKKKISFIKVATNKTKGHLTLQAKMFCQQKQEQYMDASWHFKINGEYSFSLDAMTMNWKATDPEAKRIKNEWENDEELVNEFRKIARGDCMRWLKEILKHRKEMPVPSDTSQLPSTTHHPPPTQNQAVGLIIVSSIVTVAVIVIVIVVSLFKKIKKGEEQTGHGLLVDVREHAHSSALALPTADAFPLLK